MPFESALRIGLEQSRYVNVLPDLKVRDTITRMQRDPDETEIDRKVGSEVAIRDGARALILPTIAEIGGRVRITAELVDPQTQTTVYSETADGIGKESILPSLDAINSRLRVRLGEALATVSSESLPLEKVATSNLDALRLYSMAIKAQAVGDIVQANIQLRSALRLDPGFGTARIELATNLLPLGERQEVSEQLHLALASADRLTARHTLYAEALLADFSSPRLAVEKWQALTTAYPDMFRAQEPTRISSGSTPMISSGRSMSPGAIFPSRTRTPELATTCWGHCCWEPRISRAQLSNSARRKNLVRKCKT
ncbi:MAG: hypothetical protein IPH43_09765 [Xanthomonadales bacterium]|nr:hypothetical protein [Xanthomonadales bacterium]